MGLPPDKRGRAEEERAHRFTEWARGRGVDGDTGASGSSADALSEGEVRRRLSRRAAAGAAGGPRPPAALSAAVGCALGRSASTGSGRGDCKDRRHPAVVEGRDFTCSGLEKDLVELRWGADNPELFGSSRASCGPCASVLRRWRGRLTVSCQPLNWTCARWKPCRSQQPAQRPSSCLRPSPCA